jgi:hypothetical protein
VGGVVTIVLTAVVPIEVPAMTGGPGDVTPNAVRARNALLSAAAGSVDGISAEHVVAPASLYAALAALAARYTIPSFSRQTKLACSACHYQFPQLTPFGRLFKLNGYTLTGLQTIGQPTDSVGSETLKLAPIPPASAMVVASMTRINKSIPNTQNNTASFPQEFSLFLAGQVTPNVGAFTQFTYADADGSIGIDNVDLRYAKHTSFRNRDLLFGLTVHNNPTVQDVWNTVPAWGYPFMSSEVAPSGLASTIVDGVLSQQVVGLGAYSLWNGALYTELTAYRSAPQATSQPLDESATNVTHGVAPYWRVALQRQWPTTYAMLGTFGLAAQLYPAGVAGPTNHYTDIGVDAQVERRIGTTGALIGRATFVHERQRLTGSLAESPATASVESNSLNTVRANVSLVPMLRSQFTLGVFQTSGGADNVVYPADPVTGSATGSPNTSGLTGEIVYNAWQNTRVGAQYVAYAKFNGARGVYDGAGRHAADNDALYLYFWVAF